MRLITSLLPSDFVAGSPSIAESVDVAVVIDVLRATSVAVTALGAGACEVVTCREIAEAHRLALPDELSSVVEPRARENSLLCGERGCQPIVGFDLGNSPSEYTADRVTGKRLILTTTNGTRAIESASQAKTMVLASFLNLTAIVDAIIASETAHIVCAGTDGAVTGEDVLLAGAIIEKCHQRLGSTCQWDDASSIARSWWRARIPGEANAAKLVEAFAEAAGGRNLVRVGFASDLAACAAIDTIPIVPTRSRQQPTGFTIDVHHGRVSSN